jgi:hypothetical protein
MLKEVGLVNRSEEISPNGVLSRTEVYLLSGGRVFTVRIQLPGTNITRVFSLL